MIFLPCLKMLEKIKIPPNKINKFKEIISFYNSIPIHDKILKSYHEQINLISYNKKDLILNTWNNLLNKNNLSEDEINVIKESIEEFKNSDYDNNTNSDTNNDINSDTNNDINSDINSDINNHINSDSDSNDNNNMNNIIPSIYISNKKKR